MTENTEAEQHLQDLPDGTVSAIVDQVVARLRTEQPEYTGHHQGADTEVMDPATQETAGPRVSEMPRK